MVPEAPLTYTGNTIQNHALAICRELKGASSNAPQWLLLVPAGRFEGRDKRAWVNDSPDGLVSEFQHNGADIPVDWEHSTEHKGPKGEEAPASGWITALEVRNGEVWGRVEWTERAHNQIRQREYRYYSVAFDFHTPTGRVVRITSVGLTNKPNLYTRALNQQTSSASPSKTGSVPALNRQQAAIAAAFGNTAEDLARLAPTSSTDTDESLSEARSLNREQESTAANIAKAFGNTPEDLARYANP